MHRIAMEIGTACHQQPKIGSEPVIAFDGGFIVIRVIHLERIETGDRQRLDALVDASPAGMGERSDASSAMNDANDDIRW